MNDRADSAPQTRRRRRRDRSNGSPLRAWLSWSAAVLLGVAVIGAPLACGAVHRPVLFPLLGIVAALALVTAALATTSKTDFKPVHVLALPLLFLLIALVQIVPIPAALRALLDPAGSELLRLAHLTGAQPLSLDPPETYLRFAEAAAALAVGAAALVLASGRRLRFVAPGLIAAAGLLALTVGLGHRAASENKIYGLFGGGRGLPVGPFINPNHTAELLELAAFAALAFAFARASRDGRRIWMILSAVLVAGALSALSRGSVLALGAGALTWFLLAPKSDEGVPFHRSRFAAALIGLLVIAGLALGFGAEKLASTLLATSGDSLTKVNVWWDALKIVRAHPAGIGLGAFGHVYPVYQTLPSASWYQFVENQPLGILIEAGIPGAILVLATLALTIRHFARNARRDRIEASLAAGLVTVLAHNLTDFGLETPGVLLPFCALLGAMFGRQAVTPEPEAVRRPAASMVAALSAAAVLVGIALLAAPSASDFDALLRPPLPANARDLVHQASRAHPTDHAYALAEARLEPRDIASAATRLRALNRAMILCPLCTGAHADAARDLWRLGRHRQAMLEWKTILALAPGALWQALSEIAQAGATAAEIQTFANDQNRHDVSRFLLARGMIDAAKDVLAAGNGHATLDSKLVEVQIALQLNDLDAAKRASGEALAAAPRDPRALLTAAEVAARANDNAKAIDLVQEGLRSEPANVDLNRRLLGLLMPTDRYQAIDRALDGLRRALTENGAPMTEANIASARAFERRGQFRRALAEYQAAVALAPDDTGLLLALARAAEQSGTVTIAIDAYTAVLRRAPGQAEAQAALGRIQKDKKMLEVMGATRALTGAEDK